jgi:Domain of unknown function (DUF4440)
MTPRATLGFALAFAALLFPVQRGMATPLSPTDTVIQLEARWISAILDGDRATVATILSAGFKHILNGGKLIDRAQELASITKEPFAIALSEQTVDFDATGNAAVLHGLDTITQPGKATRYQRFTDVFFKEGDRWMAVSAQENVITP